MLKLWNWYHGCLSVHPVKTQEADAKFKVDWNRVVVTSMFGFGFVGPVGHFWYEGLDKFIRCKLQLMPTSARAVATKVAMDGLIFGPVHLFVFFTYMGICAGKTIPQVKEDLKRNYVPALILEGGVWPIVQVFNFSYVPVKYQLLYVNLFCLLDSGFLSWLDQQKDAPWKQWFSFHSKNGKGGRD
ncbi:protein SYM1-like isoform X2 [Lotus japonicus]|uniref:protein SYM1-like isoform X2 n=1 Tax=Lotus japonicus TaxID=34305 RepID=UPI0025833000|nr:protein SYM1-like isoform X2 [Lotus japonicus]